MAYSFLCKNIFFPFLDIILPFHLVYPSYLHCRYILHSFSQPHSSPSCEGTRVYPISAQVKNMWVMFTLLLLRIMLQCIAKGILSKNIFASKALEQNYRRGIARSKSKRICNCTSYCQFPLQRWVLYYFALPCQQMGIYISSMALPTEYVVKLLKFCQSFQ